MTATTVPSPLYPFSQVWGTLIIVLLLILNGLSSAFFSVLASDTGLASLFSSVEEGFASVFSCPSDAFSPVFSTVFSTVFSSVLVTTSACFSVA